MNLRTARISAAVVLFCFLVVFFIPFVYNATLFQCTNGNELCLINPSGLESAGYVLFHWGAVYSFGGAGDPQLHGYDFYPGFAMLTAFGVLLFVAFPIAAAGIGLMAPEIVRKSIAARIGFIMTMGLTLAFSGLLYASILGSVQNFDLQLAIPTLVLIPTAFLLVLYGIRPDIFHNQE